MCGICGFIGEGFMADLEKMTASLAHRGPDDHGYWHDDKSRIFLGHRRLSILDIQGGHQPMATADSSLIVTYNGEIYNHLSLRKQLQKEGFVFLTDHSDTEVLLHGYRKWGPSLVEKLNGMWAFAILDRNRKEIFLSRDRFGKKPLYYYLTKNSFVFASELTSLLKHPQVPSNLSVTGLVKYFAYGYIPSPHTVIEKVQKLPGGHNLIVSYKEMTHQVRKYWDFVIEPFETVPKNPVKQWGEQLRSLLSKAVKRRLISDVPLGVFLSGGIDSSAVCHFASKHTGSDRINSFSVGFHEKSFDESAFSRKVSSLLGTRHHPEVFSIREARLCAEHVLGRLDEPMGDSSILPTYLLSKTTRKKVTVALGGDGADELFAGYDPFRALDFARLYAKLIPKPVHEGIRMLAGLLPVSHRNMSLDFRLKRTLRGLSAPETFWNPIWLGPIPPEDIHKLFGMYIPPEEIYSEAVETWNSCQGSSLVDKTLQFYTRLYLQDDILVKVDRAAMMNSLEVRAPFLDIELVDFVRRIPWRFKFRNGQTKFILKEALKPVLPPEILHRSKKGFGIPIGAWFQNGSLNLDSLSTPAPLSRKFIEKKYREHRQKRSDHRAFLWNVHVLNKWIKANSLS